MGDKGQVIGLIQPDRTPSRPSIAPGQPPRGHGPRWVPRAVVVFGVLVVVTAIIWSSDTDPVTSPNDTAVTTTTMRPLLQPRGVGVVERQRFAADPLPLWSVHSADELTPADPDSRFTLFATSGASATEGRWLSVTVTPGIREFGAVSDATRLLIGSYEATSPIDDPLRRDVYVPMLVGTAIVSARGIDDADLLTLAGSLQSTGDILQLSSLLPEGLEFVTQGTDPASMMTGHPVSRVIYTSDDPNGAPIDVTFTVGTATDVDAGVPLFPFVLRDIDGIPSFIRGTRLDRPDDLILRWRVDSLIFTLSGPVGSAVLNQFADLVRPFSAQEWEGLVYGRPPGARLASLVQVAEGTTTDGHVWTAGVRIVERDGRRLLLWAAAPLDTPQGPPYSQPLDDALAPTDTISSLVIPGATYVFAATSSTSPSLALEVLVGGQVVRVPYVDVGVDGVRVAAYAFSEPLPYFATVVEDPAA